MGCGTTSAIWALLSVTLAVFTQHVPLQRGEWIGEKPMTQIPAEQIREGDIVDITPLLDDTTAKPWDFGPGLDEKALEAARAFAECENAVADASEVQNDRVMLYTDQMNFVVPLGYLVERVDS